MPALLFAVLLLILMQAAINKNSIPETGRNLPDFEAGRDIPRRQVAYAERMNALFMYYQDEAERAKVAQDAETARWNAHWEFYLDEAERAKRARDAETARWNALWEYSLAEQTVNTK
jgi:hypothetical protein